jgi:virulence-associated protein VagC
MYDDQGEVLVRRDGSKIILEPADEWSPDFHEALGTLREEIERPTATPIGKMKDPFE